jgi:CheY-like chemotaxis protein
LLSGRKPEPTQEKRTEWELGDLLTVGSALYLANAVGFISVPRATEMAAMTASSSPHAPPPSGSSELKDVRILLVEDSWHVGNAIKRLLRALGADVAGPAAAIADAERLIAECKPDVAIIDINLRDGEKANPLLDRLQEEGIPVIVMTGYTTAPIKPGTVEAVLQKPVSVERFLTALGPIVARLRNR